MAIPTHLHPTQPIKLYRYPLSGHSHRVELFLSLLGLPVELIDVDLVAGAQKAPAFLEVNPFGQVPVIQDGEVTVADSNAILVYLANKYADEQWLPRDPVGAAGVQRWLSVAAGLVAFGPAAARLITVFKAPLNAAEVIARANGLFAVMETALQNSAFLTGAGKAPFRCGWPTFSRPKIRTLDWRRRCERMPRLPQKPMPPTSKQSLPNSQFRTRA